jgi:enoyl-CoA hydratase
MAAAVNLERRGVVAVLTLARPERHNALSEPMWEALDARLDELESGPLPRALVVTGAGDAAFCAGFDVNPDNPQVSRLMASVQKGDRGPAEDLLRRVRSSVDRLAGLPVPVIAALNGLAYGGGAELAVRCDLRVADPAARLCFSEVRLGLMPDWGGGPALARLIGPSRAADLILTARRVGAEEALALGLVNRVSGAGGALDEAVALAEAIGKNGPRAVRSALAVLRRSADVSFEDALEHELVLAAELIASGECLHGIPAFMARKDPVFPDVE